MKYDVSIVEYLGCVNYMIFSIISIIHNNKYYECIMCYDKQNYILTIDEELDEDLGYRFVDDVEYETVFNYIKDKLENYDSIIEKLENVEIR